MPRIAERLKELGIELPPVPPPGGNYVPAVQTGNLLYTSGNVAHGAAQPLRRRVPRASDFHSDKSLQLTYVR